MVKKSLHRFHTPFEAIWTARRLAGFSDNENLLPAFASAKIKILPYQIAAARFALRSSQLKGCILCDEGSLGKTYEALLVASQRWYEGKEHILIILPQNLMQQWQNKLENEFSLPLISWENYTNESQGLCLITYDQAIQGAERLETIRWDLAVFDEADFLFKPENKSVITIKKAVGDAFKLLLTPTPMTMSIMDIYGLIHFIDETLLPDAESFYARYFRKPENYQELSSWVSKFAFRTLKKQVQQYVNFTRRLPSVLNYTPENNEKKLYELTEKYLAIPNKTAYPQMDNYRLSLQFYHTLSSSPQAFSLMLEAPIERAVGDERLILQTIQQLAREISISAKMDVLLNALLKIFSHLKSRKENQKAIIFVENLTTVTVLAELLKSNQYNIITHLDKDALDTFRNNKNIQILITNDIMAKGLDIEYCPIVVNYDLLYNAVETEQRICRCHRQGQQSDVLVINLLSKENFSDVRILELINKRSLQFDGIFGMSDEIVGNFEQSLEDVLHNRRLPLNIREDFSKNLENNQKSNEQIIDCSENTLFTTFTKDIAEKVTVSPKYIEEQAEFINQDLWEVVKFYFEKHHPQYIIDDIAQTLTLPDDKQPPHLFYYNTGSRNVPYIGKRIYSMRKDFKPSYGRITLTSILVRGVLDEISCFSEGSLELENPQKSCEIYFYRTELKKNKTFLREYDILTGQTDDGQTLSEEECYKLLSLPIKNYQENGRERPYWLCTDSLLWDKLDFQLEEDIKNRYLQEKEGSFDTDIDLIKIKAERQKSLLEQNIAQTRQDVKKVKDFLSNANDRLEELKIQKQLNFLEKELRQKEEGLFFDQMRIDANLEEEKSKFGGKDDIAIKISPIFKIKI